MGDADDFVANGAINRRPGPTGIGFKPVFALGTLKLDLHANDLRWPDGGPCHGFAVGRRRDRDHATAMGAFGHISGKVGSRIHRGTAEYAIKMNGVHGLRVVNFPV